MPRRGFAVLPLAALLAVGCFDQPVYEGVEIVLLDGGEIQLSVRVEIRPQDSDDLNPELERRLEERRQGLLGGWDPWVRRFDGLAAASDRTTWEKEDGQLVSWERRARLRDADELTRFFADTGIGVFVTEAAGEAELAVYPGSGQGASRRVRKRVERAIDEWSGELAVYARAAAALYEYLEERPARAAACFGHLFRDLVDGDERARLGPLRGAEEDLVEALGEAIEASWEVLVVQARNAYSLEELSRQVYDPFPSELAVTPPESPLEVEGFEETEDGRFTVPRVGLWGALRSLEASWVEPALVGLYVEHTRAAERIDPFELAGRERKAEPRPAPEIRRAIEERLSPAPIYRLVWPEAEE